MEIFESFLVTKYIAHHGLHNSVSQENSLSAISNAIENNYAIFINVHQIGDGTLIVFHDEELKHITSCDGYVNNISSKYNLKNYKLNGSKESIPTLDKVLKTIDGKVPLLIEIKNFGKVGNLEEKLANMLKNYKGEYAVCSYNPQVLSWFKQIEPDILRGQMAGRLKHNEIPIKLRCCKRRALKNLKFNKRVSEPDFIIYEAAALPNHYVKKYKKIPLIATTVKSQQEYMKVAKHCDNIIFEGFQPHI